VYGEPAVTVAPMRDGKIFDSYDGNCFSQTCGVGEVTFEQTIDGHVAAGDREALQGLLDFMKGVQSHFKARRAEDRTLLKMILESCARDIAYIEQAMAKLSPADPDRNPI
jgi:hypothetical protein